MVDSEHKFVFELEFKLQNNLTSMLDVSEAWETLATFLQMPASDVDVCRQHPSPSASILRVWSAHGYSLNHLYLMLTTIRHKRAMQLIQPFVTEKYLAAARRYDEQIQVPPPEDAADAAGCSGMSMPRAQAAPQNSARKSSGSQVPQSTACATELSSAPSSSLASSASSSHLSTLQNTMSVRYSELLEATNDFSAESVIGRGGYGIVYRGEWKHTTVAIKRIICKSADSASAEHEKERLRQSLVELRAMALYRHDNVLPLYGYSLDGAEPCLVYQYMAGGSLEDRLLCRANRAPLSWVERGECMLGAARGLNFLHTIAAQPLIHGDIKSANILCDQHLCAKIGDFGLCRSGQPELPDSVMPLIASHIKGTLAYLPPEFLRNKRLSTKLDVYGFGVVGVIKT